MGTPILCRPCRLFGRARRNPPPSRISAFPRPVVRIEPGCHTPDENHPTALVFQHRQGGFRAPCSGRKLNTSMHQPRP